MKRTKSSSRTPAFTNIGTNDDLIKRYYEEMEENIEVGTQTTHSLYIDFGRYNNALKENADKLKAFNTDMNSTLFCCKNHIDSFNTSRQHQPSKRKIKLGKKISAETKFSIIKWSIENKESVERWSQVFKASKSSIYKILREYKLNGISDLVWEMKKWNSSHNIV